MALKVIRAAPKVCDYCSCGRRCWCDRQPMGMDVIDLINYLRFEGPCDEDFFPTANEEYATPRGDESADEGKTVDKGKNSEKEPMEEGNPKEEPMEEEDPEEEPMDEENPKEGLSESEEELIDEEDPEKDLKEDPEEDPEEDLAEEGVEFTEEDNLE